MALIQTAALRPNGSGLSNSENYQTYCGLDCMLTHEIRTTLRDLGPEPPIYSFTRALQGPYLAMMKLGFRVDESARRYAVSTLYARKHLLQQRLDMLSEAVWGKGLNSNSPAQLKDFLYDKMGLPEVWISKKGERKVSTGREALEKLDQYLYAQPFIALVLALRDIGKQLSVLDGAMDIEDDGSKRFRAGYNITGTETGRPSSSENAFGSGSNAQNIASSLRYIFTSDPGKKLGVIDFEQVEARDVGFICGCLFDDWTFLDSCESGDLHTNNSKLIWPELPWTGDPKADRLVAEGQFYRDFSYRDMSKRGGHLTNYYGTAYTAARSLKVPISIMVEFQNRYCKGPEAAFPAIPRWWAWIAQQLQTEHKLSTLFGLERYFFGRPDDDTTLREAIAFIPQGTTGNRTNLALWRIWRYMPEVQVISQTYDSVTFQYPEELERQVIPKALELMAVPLTSPSGRLYIVPGEAKIGWNWASVGRDGSNPYGLAKWSESKPDKRKLPSGANRIAPGAVGD